MSDDKNARIDALSAEVLATQRRLDRANRTLDYVRARAESWEVDARRLNTKPCLPASTLMDCREEILAILDAP